MINNIRSEINMKLITGEENSVWDNFVASGINPCFYQNSAFIDYYRYKVSRVYKIAFLKKGDIFAAIAGGISKENTELFLSPFSASFGGFCYSRETKLKDVFGAIEIMEEFLNDNGIRKIVIRQTPSIYFIEPDDYILYVLAYFGYKPVSTDLTLYISNNGKVSDTFLRNVKKAKREGLVFTESENASDIFSFIHQQKLKKDIPFSISEGELIDLKERFPDLIKCYSVLLEEKIIAAIIVYYLNKITALGFNWAHDDDFQSLRPVDFLLFSAAEAVFKNGSKYFDLGTTTLSGEPNWGVTRFKENLNPCGALRITYEKDL
ncbi:MAG: GNAT family N-acetyltransferase [bacterium]